MTKIIAIAGCSISSVVCFFGAWKLCEVGVGSWFWFLLTGILIALVTGGVANHPNNSETPNDGI